MRYEIKSAGVAAVLATGLLCATNASAEGYALDRFDPAPVGDRLFGVQDPLTHGHMKLHVGLLADYAYNPLVVTHRRGQGFDNSIVDHQLFMHLNASFALWERLNINVDVPLAIVQSGTDQSYEGQQILAPDGVEFGDIRIGVRGSIWGERRSPFQLGVGGYFWLPTGAADSYVSDNFVRGTVEALVAGDIDPAFYNVAVGAQFRESKMLLGVPQGSMFQLSGGIGVYLGDDRQVTLGPEFKLAVTTNEPQLKNINAEVLLGAKYRFMDDLQIGMAAGPGVAEGHGTPDLRGVLSFAYTPRIDKTVVKDSDGDGIADGKDACPAAAGPSNEDPTLNGCPKPAEPIKPADSDSDGIPDDKDACPALAGLASPDATANGCPGDSDGDGVRDDKDACPSAAPPAGMADPDKPGCALSDGDGDGVADKDDACPDIKGLAGDDKAFNGCPGDSDGDGIRDHLDACPNLRGADDADPTKRGCPKTVRFKDNAIVILQQVQFNTGTATIKPVSNEILDEVAEALKSHAEIIKLEVGGHTDSKGSAFLNKSLSKRRAEAVMKALVKRGVEASRLSAQGFGADKPIGDNGTDEGRAQNRRVEFKILEKKK